MGTTPDAGEQVTRKAGAAESCPAAAQLTELFQTRLDMATVGSGLEQPQALLLAKCPEQPLPRCVLRSWCPLGILAHGQSVCKAEEDATEGGWLSTSMAHWGLLYTPRFSLTWVWDAVWVLSFQAS